MDRRCAGLQAPDRHTPHRAGATGGSLVLCDHVGRRTLGNGHEAVTEGGSCQGQGRLEHGLLYAAGSGKRGVCHQSELDPRISIRGPGAREGMGSRATAGAAAEPRTEPARAGL